MKSRTAQRIAAVAALIAPFGLVASTSSAASRNVNVVGYSIVSGAYNSLEIAFQKTAAGQGVTFQNSFGASTAQAQSVLAGQPADLVNFSLEPDIQQLVDAGLVATNWNTTATAKSEKGMVTDSVVLLVVRRGNPLHITGWNSLIKSGVQIVTPDPISSGSARWNLLAAYESKLQQAKKPAGANTFINQLIGRVVSEPSSGGKALSAFLAGTGNVLLAYEADALTMLSTNSNLQVVEPVQNLLIENPAALTTTGSSNPAARAFYHYIFSSSGQEIWLNQHFRPTSAKFTNKVRSAFYLPATITTVTKLGGWKKVDANFFSDTGIITRAEHSHGFTS
jgi:sulfate/thiosulfate-binding protein